LLVDWHKTSERLTVRQETVVYIVYRRRGRPRHWVYISLCTAMPVRFRTTSVLPSDWMTGFLRYTALSIRSITSLRYNRLTVPMDLGVVIHHFRSLPPASKLNAKWCRCTTDPRRHYVPHNAVCLTVASR